MLEQRRFNSIIHVSVHYRNGQLIGLVTFLPIFVSYGISLAHDLFTLYSCIEANNYNWWFYKTQVMNNIRNKHSNISDRAQTAVNNRKKSKCWSLIMWRKTKSFFFFCWIMGTVFIRINYINKTCFYGFEYDFQQCLTFICLHMFSKDWKTYKSNQ